MNISFILVLYLLSLLLVLPVLLIGFLIQPAKSTKSQVQVTSPQKLLELMSQSKKDLHHALKIFQNQWLDATSCEQKIWLEMITQLTLSKWLSTKKLNQLQKKLIQANPSLEEQISSTIDTVLKNKK